MRSPVAVQLVGVNTASSWLTQCLARRGAGPVSLGTCVGTGVQFHRGGSDQGTVARWSVAAISGGPVAGTRASASR